MSTRNSLDMSVFAHTLEYTNVAKVTAQWDISAPLNARSELVMASFQIQTVVAAADRVVHVSIVRGANAHVLGSSCFAHVASTTWNYIVGQHGSLNPLAPFTDLYIPICSLPLITPGDTIRFLIHNHQAGDSWHYRAHALKFWNLE